MSRPKFKMKISSSVISKYSTLQVTTWKANWLDLNYLKFKNCETESDTVPQQQHHHADSQSLLSGRPPQSLPMPPAYDHRHAGKPHPIKAHVVPGWSTCAALTICTLHWRILRAAGRSLPGPPFCPECLTRQASEKQFRFRVKTQLDSNRYS